jgi:2,4-dienoyl-CoA reductase-like NADH-dependent reductase (Old Yellow Enzyme family)/thioredoxin reductase
MENKYPHLFSPIKIRGQTFRNRIFVDPNNHCLQAREPAPTEAAIKYYANKAKGGAALVNCGSCDVDPEYHTKAEHTPFWNQYNIHDHIGLRYFVKQAEAIHFYGAKAAIGLHMQAHGGYNLADQKKGRKIYGPSPAEEPDGLVIHEMPESEMERLADAYAAAANNALVSSFDAVSFYCSCRGLTGSFLSTLYNKRTDKYGGSIENRARFILMVLDRIRAKVGDNLVIYLKMDGEVTHNDDGGFPLEDRVRFCQLIERYVDIIDSSRGMMIDTAVDPISSIEGPPPTKQCDLIGALRNIGFKLPLMVSNNLGDPELAEQFLASGYADIIAHVKQGIADPETYNKARSGRYEDIVPCIRCSNCHDDHFTTHRFSCSVNPVIGREHNLHFYTAPPERKKKVAIVGGGPAGMEAAIIAAGRGHEVTLYETRNELGGNIRFADHVPFKSTLSKFKNYLIRNVEKAGVRVLLNTVATPELLAEAEYDAVFAAIGARPLIPDIKGIDSAKVIYGCDAYDRLNEIGQRVAVIGGGLAGVEEGLYLAYSGEKDVTVVEMGPALAPDDHIQHHRPLMQYVETQPNLTAYTGTLCTAVTEDGITCTRDGQELNIRADTVILAAGMQARLEEAEAFRNTAFDFEPLGDCLKPGKVKMAIRTGFDAAVRL